MRIERTSWIAAIKRWGSGLFQAAVGGLLFTLMVVILGVSVKELVPLSLAYLCVVKGNRLATFRGDAIEKTLLFCLPGYRESLRKSALIAGVYWGLAGGFFCLWMFRDSAGVGLDDRPSPVSGLALGMMLSFVGNLRLVLSTSTWLLIQLLAIPLLVLGVFVLFPLLEYPAIVVPSALTVCVLIWKRLGDMDRVRQGHRIIVTEALERRAQVGVVKTVSPRVERFFMGGLDRIQGRRRVWLWANFYQAFALILSYWRWILIVTLATVSVLGYLGPITWAGFLCLAGSAWFVRLPIDSKLLLTEGRKEKELGTVVLAAVATAMLLVAASLIVAFSWPLSLIMPGASGGAYVGLRADNIPLAIVLVPWVFLGRLLNRGALNHTQIGVLICVIIAIFWIAFSSPVINFWIDIPSGILFGIVSALGWIVFGLVLKLTCDRGTL